MNKNIRKATLHDIQDMYNIENNVYGKYGWNIETFRSEINKETSHYLIYEDKCVYNKIIGYIGAWVVIDEGHITTLVVSPKYRRNHVADILLYNLVIELLNKGIKWLTLEVKVTNTPAINLYKKFRFNEIGIRKKYYEDNNEDALILWTNKIADESFIKNMESIMSSILLNNSMLINHII